MNIIITTDVCLKSKNFNNAIANAFNFKNPWAEGTVVANNRLTCTKEGYQVRFQIKNFNVAIYRDLMYGTKNSHTIELMALPVPLTSTTQLL